MSHRILKFLFSKTTFSYALHTFWWRKSLRQRTETACLTRAVQDRLWPWEDSQHSSLIPHLTIISTFSIHYNWVSFSNKFLKPQPLTLRAFCLAKSILVLILLNLYRIDIAYVSPSCNQSSLTSAIPLLFFSLTHSTLRWHFLYRLQSWAPSCLPTSKMSVCPIPPMTISPCTLCPWWPRHSSNLTFVYL